MMAAPLKTRNSENMIEWSSMALKDTARFGKRLQLGRIGLSLRAFP